MPQWSLVGDAILSLREQAADPPANLPAPSNISASGSTGGSTTFYLIVTQLTPWGESAPSTEFSLAAQAVSSTITVTGNCSYAATSLKVYVTIVGTGQEDRYFAYSTPAGGQGAFSIAFSLSSTLVIGFPPQRSSAWLPDTDGTSLSAAALYRWINEGLDACTAITEGIRDITGIPSTSAQAQYQLVSNWRKISAGFFDGWAITFGNKSDIFRRSNVVGISGTTTMNQDSVVQQIELYPQSSRTSGNGTLNGNLSATATSVPYTPGSSGWVLGFGLALIGTYPGDPSQCELVYYSGNASNQLSPVTRGMGGTVAQAWPSGTPVLEANIYLTGLRYPIHYQQGQSANQLNLPPAWIDALKCYLDSRFKGAEQNLEEQQGLLKLFEAKCQTIRGNREPMAPRQVQIGGAQGVEVVSGGVGGFFGGVILP